MLFQKSYFLQVVLVILVCILVWILVGKLAGPPLVKQVHGYLAASGLAERSVEHSLATWGKISWGTLPILLIFGLFALPHEGRNQTTLIIAVLIVTAWVRLPGLFSRSIWEDEAVTLLETAGHAMPHWPRNPAPASSAKVFLQGSPTLTSITHDLRATDIHPPVYFWGLTVWQRWWGSSLEWARGFSVVWSLCAVAALYFLLRAGRIENPHILALIYSLSTLSVYFGTSARPYALAIFFVIAAPLFAYLAREVATHDRMRAAAHSLAMALCAGLALQTNYLTLFPVGLTLAWFVFNLWRLFRPIAIASPLVALLIGSIGLKVVLAQLSARPEQAAGFAGLLNEVRALLRLNLKAFWEPQFMSSALTYPPIVVSGLSS